MPVSIELSDLLSAISGLIALFALVLSVYSVRVANRIATSDFQTSQKVKSDVAQLVATLRSIMIKGVIYSQQAKDIRDDADHPEYISNRIDLENIEHFLHSTTALAFYSFVSERSKLAQEAGRKGENWRTFFLHMVTLSATQNQWLASKRAADLERMLDHLKENDFVTLSRYLEDIPNALEMLFQNREHDVILQVLVGLPKSRREHPDFFKAFINYLREEKAIQDPDVEVFWSAITGEVDVLKEALDQGANPNITDGELMNRYSDLADEFEAEYDPS